MPPWYDPLIDKITEERILPLLFESLFGHLSLLAFIDSLALLRIPISKPFFNTLIWRVWKNYG